MRILSRIAPQTLEQSIAIFMLANFLSFFPRPFAAGIEELHSNYGLHLTIQALQVVMGMSGLVLYLKRRVGSLWAVGLFAPIPLYGVSLFLFYVNGDRVGGLGWTGYILATGLTYGWYIQRSRRERKAINPNGHF